MFLSNIIFFYFCQTDFVFSQARASNNFALFEAARSAVRLREGGELHSSPAVHARILDIPKGRNILGEVNTIRYYMSTFFDSNYIDVMIPDSDASTDTADIRLKC